MNVSRLKDLPTKWRTIQKGEGQVFEEEYIALKLPKCESSNGYSNAQIDDYPNLKRKDFVNEAPLKFKIKARLKCEGEPKGTFGFGFWNDPFLMTEPRVPSLPKAIWFFGSSSESSMNLAVDIPGHGWKMGCIDAWSWKFLMLIPTVPLSIPLMWIPFFRRKLWPIAQKFMKCHEALVPVSIKDWHEYEIDWQTDLVTFYIDGSKRFETPAPKGKLGLVIWIDNQYMKIDPRAKMKCGTIKIDEEQCLEIESFEFIKHG